MDKIEEVKKILCRKMLIVYQGVPIDVYLPDNLLIELDKQIAKIFEARIEALIEAVEKASHTMNTNMTGISLSKETWQVLKATHTNNKEKADG